MRFVFKTMTIVQDDDNAFISGDLTIAFIAQWNKLIMTVKVSHTGVYPGIPHSSILNYFKCEVSSLCTRQTLLIIFFFGCKQNIEIYNYKLHVIILNICIQRAGHHWYAQKSV